MHFFSLSLAATLKQQIGHRKRMLVDQSLGSLSLREISIFNSIIHRICAAQLKADSF